MTIRFLTLIAFILIGAPALTGCGSDTDTAADSGENGGAEHAAAQSEGAFCEGHQIAEAQCVWCHPDLMESLGFCRGHGVAEAVCYRCNPALIPAFKAVGDWCAGHDRPESQCYICNPELDPFAQGNPGALPDSLTAAPQDWNTAGTSRMQQPPTVYCTTQELVIRFEHDGIAEQAGLEMAPVERRPLTKTVTANAEVTYDGDRHAQIAPQVPGVVTAVHKDFGDIVQHGEPLLTLSSAHLGAAKSTYLQAVAAKALWERNHARETNLLEQGVATEKDVLEAETRLAEARIQVSESEQNLFTLGLSAEEIEAVRRDQDTGSRYVVNAPFAGTVVNRSTAVGEVVDASKTLMEVADLSRMWALIDVYESDLNELRVGQPVVLRAEGLQGRTFAGRISWVSSQVDPRTRTLRARAELENPRGLLRANMFAQAEIQLRRRTPTLVVPAAAVQWEGCCNVVFVKDSESVYKPRKVHLGIGTGTQYEVLSGVDEGEEVVTQGSFLLKTEILKSSIGAGCCEVDPGA